MSRALCISATFLTGRYHGEEWPPSPARLVQALVAGVMTGRYRAHRGEVAPALLWLERQPAPRILAVPAAETRPYRLAVPNNDMDYIAREWSAGREANPAELRTMKLVRPRLVDAAPPHVRYLWEVNGTDPAPPPLAAASVLSHCMHTLGWGIDMSFAGAELLSGPPPEGGYEMWAPSHPPGAQLAVPVPGFLSDLDATYARFAARAAGAGVDTDTRPGVYRLQCYARAGERRAPYVAFGLDVPGKRYPGWSAAMIVAAWLRHAAAVALRQEGVQDEASINSYVLGHAPEGADAGRRISFVPLPSIGYAKVDSSIRRVLFAEPLGAEGAVTRFLARKLPGWVLTGEGGTEEACLAHLDDRKVLPFYCPPPHRPSRFWHSVTPVILHGYNSSHGRISPGMTERLLLRAVEMAGYGESQIARLAFQPAPLWPGTGAAGQMTVPHHLEGLPRYHVAVEFGTAVPGPVLAGLGRHCGIGVFAAPGLGNGGA